MRASKCDYVRLLRSVMWMFCMSTVKYEGSVHLKYENIMFMGIYWEYGDWYSDAGKLRKLVLT